MNRTVLQIPINVTLRREAERAAESAGFSSVQEVVRVFLKKLASQTIDVSFYDKNLVLSKKAEKRYSTMVQDIRKGKNILNEDALEI